MKYGPWLADGTRSETNPSPKAATQLVKKSRGRPPIDRDKAATLIREFGIAGAAKILGVSRMSAYRIQREIRKMSK